MKELSINLEDEFALAFLMPRKEFIRIFDENTVDGLVNLTAVAQYFNVRVIDAERRGKMLGLLRVW